MTPSRATLVPNKGCRSVHNLVERLCIPSSRLLSSQQSNDHVELKPIIAIACKALANLRATTAEPPNHCIKPAANEA